MQGGPTKTRLESRERERERERESVIKKFNPHSFNVCVCFRPGAGSVRVD